MDPRFYYPDSDLDTPDILFTERISDRIRILDNKSQAYLEVQQNKFVCSTMHTQREHETPTSSTQHEFNYSN